MLKDRSIETISSAILPTLCTCKKLLFEHYGKDLQGVVLFGSAARCELTEESDLDLLVLLPQPLDYLKELWEIVDVLYDTQLEASHWISAKPAARDEFEAGSVQLYRNIKQEGILL